MPDLKKTIATQLKDSARVLTATAKQAALIDKAAQELLRCFRNGGKLLSFGNGGSSCDAQNFADELTGRYRRNRPGNSKNVLRAAAAAREMGLTVIGLAGHTGGKLKALCDHCLCIPSDSTARIQEAHITVIQIWCGILEDELFPDAPLAHG